MKKNPWVAAGLNIIISGLGYIYVGNRREFGFLLLAGEIMTFFALVQNPVLLSLLSSGWILIASILWKAALALDGYSDARS